EPAMPPGGPEALLQPDDVMLTTVGIGIGSTTSHVMLARLRLQRLADALSSGYVVVEREVIHRSPILLTPFKADGRIDVTSLELFVGTAYGAASLRPDEVDTGAVILTGAALERSNARAIDELFAAHGGRFVCATAGHRLEAIRAAHGDQGLELARALDERRPDCPRRSSRDAKASARPSSAPRSSRCSCRGARSSCPRRRRYPCAMCRSSGLSLPRWQRQPHRSRARARSRSRSRGAARRGMRRCARSAKRSSRRPVRTIRSSSRSTPTSP